jgi:hypothetical protein
MDGPADASEAGNMAGGFACTGTMGGRSRPLDNGVSTQPFLRNEAPMKKELKAVTLSELRSELTRLLSMPDDTLVYFGAGDLTWVRFKGRGEMDGRQLMQVEFEEVYRVTGSFDDDA